MAVLASELREFSRVAPNGARVDIALPEAAGPIEWFGTTRLSGAGFLRGFSFAPIGEYKVIPKKIFPGGRHEVFQRRGFDLMLFEAADRSNSCLVWAGPYNEATTWFGGPAPREELLNRVTSAVHFTDSPGGARVTAEPAANLQQHTTMLVAQNDRILVMFRDARTESHTLPEWQGMRQGDTEIWRSPRALEPQQAEAVKGTAFEWRYLMANPTTVFEVIFQLMPGENAAESDSLAETVLSGTRSTWTGP
jgi:hypothetical protein